MKHYNDYEKNIPVKLKDIHLFKENLMTIFDHFKKYNITSSISNTERIDELLENIFESEFLYYDYYEGINYFQINFKYPISSLFNDHDKDYFVLFYIFGIEKKQSSLMIDISIKDDCFINFAFEDEKLIPFIKELIDENGNIKITNFDHEEEKTIFEEKNVNDIKFMDNEELKDFLEKNNKMFKPIQIEVD
jgi:hypothetical protein